MNRSQDTGIGVREQSIVVKKHGIRGSLGNREQGTDLFPLIESLQNIHVRQWVRVDDRLANRSVTASQLVLLIITPVASPVPGG